MATNVPQIHRRRNPDSGCSLRLVPEDKNPHPFQLSTHNFKPYLILNSSESDASGAHSLHPETSGLRERINCG